MSDHKKTTYESSKEKINIQKNKQYIYEYLFHIYNDPIYIVDTNGEVVTVNESFTSSFHFSPQHINEIFERWQPKQDDNPQTYYTQVLNGKLQTYDSVSVMDNGCVVETIHTLYPIYKQKDIIGVIGIINDITRLKRQDQKVNELEMNLQSAEKLIDLGIWDYDVNEDKAYWSDKMYDIFGMDKVKDQPPTYEQINEFIHPDDREYFIQRAKQVIKERSIWEAQFRILRPDGAERVVNQYANVLVDDHNQTVRIIGTTHDITHLKWLEDQKLEHDTQQKTLYNNLDACVWSHDITMNKLSFCSKGVEPLTGYTVDDFLSGQMNWIDLVHEEDLPKYTQKQRDLTESDISYGQYRILHHNGEVKWIQDKTIPSYDQNGQLIRLDGIAIDITKQKQAEEQASYLADHDYLTNLPNRKLFVEELTSVLQKAEAPFAIMYIDMDGFKRINDTLGHSIGDQLLIEIAERLKTITTHNLVARMGGDEFSILIQQIEDINQVVTIAKDWIQHLNEPYFINNYELFMTPSIGIATYPIDGHDAQTLLKKADAALYRAKNTGKNNYQIYSSAMDIESFKTYQLEKDLRKAVQFNELTLHYQPKVDGRNNRMIGAEALIRWEHPDWKMVFPNEFIPIAEENGLIFQMTDWTIRKVCEQLKVWENKGLPIVPISFNLSPKRMLRDDWVETIIRILEETKVDARLLEIEITESILIQNEETFLADINRLKELGIRLAIDDFGTGYSSLLYLRKFNVDTIKIDRYFINEYLSTKTAPITEALIQLSHNLNMTVVAEGVEEIEQMAFLQSQGCDQMQGYLFSRPVPVEAFEKLLMKPILHPTADSSQKQIDKIGKAFRINLPFPISANMTIKQIKGKVINLGKTEVLIEKISLSGLYFLTHLKLPIHQDIILELELELLGTTVKLLGHIVWKEDHKDEFVQYGLQFDLTITEQKRITALLTHLDSQLHIHSFLPNCRFVQENKNHYLKAIQAR